MKESIRLIYSDLYRYCGVGAESPRSVRIKSLLKCCVIERQFKAQICRQKARHARNIFTRIFWGLWYRHYSVKYGLQISSSVNIGPGFRIAHWDGVVINNNVRIGSNFTIHQNCLLGHSLGKYPGFPVIGDRVFMSANSVVVGGVTIGNDVLIGPCTVVNVPVPDNSIVIGSPCRIIPREKASAPYIKYLYEENHC